MRMVGKGQEAIAVRVRQKLKATRSGVRSMACNMRTAHAGANTHSPNMHNGHLICGVCAIMDKCECRMIPCTPDVCD